MHKLPAININSYYSVTLDTMGQVSLHKANQSVVGTMSYYYTRNDLPLLISRHYPSADLRLIHNVMQQLDEQMDQLAESDQLKVGRQNVAVYKKDAL